MTEKPYQKYIDEFTQTLNQRREDFCIRHSGHDVRHLVPVKLSIPHVSYGGLAYMECFDCGTVSNGKVLHFEVKGDKLIMSVR